MAFSVPASRITRARSWVESSVQPWRSIIARRSPCQPRTIAANSARSMSDVMSSGSAKGQKACSPPPELMMTGGWRWGGKASRRQFMASASDGGRLPLAWCGDT